MANTTTTTRSYTRKPLTLATCMAKENFVMPSNEERPTPEEIELACNIVRRTYANYPITVADAFLADLKDDLGVDDSEESGDA